MVMLETRDIQTTEVLAWQGLHLFHFAGSTCSQKARIFLRLKGLSWQSHHVNLARMQHLEPFYMGINPRGLVPTLIHDGQVIIESNDILQYIEAKFPTPALIPPGHANDVRALLKAEDDLHLDIRALTMRFVFPTFLTKRPEKHIQTYENSGTGTVGGVADANREREVKFWRDMNTNNGITDAQAIRAFDRFKTALDEFEQRLEQQAYLAGPDRSVVDIAWYIYARRLLDAGYPLSRLHPRVNAWFEKLHANPDFSDEVPSGGPPGAIRTLLHLAQKVRGTTLQALAEQSAQ